MKSIFFTLSVVVLVLGMYKCDDLHVGTTVGNSLVYMEEVNLSKIPFNTRIKNVFYSDQNNKIIRGISAIDLNKSKGSKSKATVTSGGVGSTFVNVRLKGERGEALSYQVQIFA